MAEDLNTAVGDSAAQVGAKLGAVAGGLGAAAGAAAPGGTPPGGGHFAFEPDQIRAVITEWDKLIEAYETDRQRAVALTNVRSPGEEYASRSMAAFTNASGQKVMDSILTQKAYCESQRKKFEDALNQYLGVDDTEAGNISRQLPAGGTDQPSSGGL